MSKPIAVIKRVNNDIRVTYFSGEEEVFPYNEETMNELNNEAIRQIRELVSDIPFVTKLKNVGIIATLALIIPSLDTESTSIVNPFTLIGLASFFSFLSFALSDDVNERRKAKIYLSIKSELDEHYDDLKHLKSYKIKGKLTEDNLSQYTLNEVKRVKRELKDIEETKKLIKEYGISYIKQ